MRCTIQWVVTVAAVGAMLPALAAEDKKNAPAAVSNPPAHVAELTTLGTVTGTVAKVDGGSITIRVPTLTSGTSKGSRYAGKGANLSVTNKDETATLATDVKVRLRKLPRETDANGKTILRSPDEVMKLKGTEGLPGYEADLKDVKPNMTVMLRLAKPKGAKGDSVTQPYATLVVIENETQPAKPTSPEPAEKKK